MGHSSVFFGMRIPPPSFPSLTNFSPFLSVIRIPVEQRRAQSYTSLCVFFFRLRFSLSWKRGQRPIDSPNFIFRTGKPCHSESVFGSGLHMRNMFGSRISQMFFFPLRKRVCPDPFYPRCPPTPPQHTQSSPLDLIFITSDWL